MSLVAPHTLPEQQYQMGIYREHLTGSTGGSQGKSQVSILLMILGFCSHKGHQQLCLALTQHLHQTHTHTHTHHQMDTQGLGTTPITPGEPLPSSGVSVSRHSQLHRTDGVWRVETPKQIIQPPQPPKLFPLRGTGPSLGRPYVLLGRCLFK